MAKVGSNRRLMLFLLAPLVLTLGFSAIAVPAHAQLGVEDCPNYNGLGSSAPLISASLLAFSSSTVGNTITYQLITSDQSPSDGIPGVIEYCVYPNSGDTSGVSSAAHIYVGVVGAWDATVKSDQVAFDRDGGGDPNNIPLDGSAVDVGSITYTSLPTSQLIVAHINWAAQCPVGTTTCFKTLQNNGFPPEEVPEFGSGGIAFLLGTIGLIGAIGISHRMRWTDR